MKRLIFFLFLSIGSSNTFASEDDLVLTADHFLELITNFHPMAKQARLQTDLGRAKLIEARSLFDPKLFATFDNKVLDGKQYYNDLRSGMSMNSGYGPSFEFGYDQSEGLFNDPPSSTPEDGLLYFGIKLPLGNGLVIDKQRAELKLAKVYQEASEIQRDIMLNELILRAGNAYWKWFEAHNRVQLSVQALDAAEQRLAAVVRDCQIGERAAIDSTEARIQWLDRSSRLLEAELDLFKVRNGLSVYLWNEDGLPILPQEGVSPTDPANLAVIDGSNLVYDEFLSIGSNHILGRMAGIKINEMEIKKRLAAEQLRPKLNLSYQALLNAGRLNNDPTDNFNNRKWGIDLMVPLSFRSGIGQHRFARTQLKIAELDRDLKLVELDIKARNALNELQTSAEQMKLYEQTVREYERLLNAERRLFEIGESSLFLVNRRELSYFGVRQKLVELKAKNQAAEIAFKYALGILGNELG